MKFHIELHLNINSFKMFRCCLKFFISLTQWHKAKLRAIAPKSNYFKPITLRLKTFIYNSNKKIIYNFCMYGSKIPQLGNEKFFTVGIFRKNPSKSAKLIVEPRICDYLNKNRFSSFLTKQF